MQTTTDTAAHHHYRLVRCLYTREIHKIHAYALPTNTHSERRGNILLSRVRMRRGKRAEEFFRLTDEARSSLLECHCKVQGIYVPFREPTSTSTHVRYAAPCRLHLHLRPRTRTRFVLIYVDEQRGVPVSTSIFIFDLLASRCSPAPSI